MNRVTLHVAFAAVLLLAGPRVGTDRPGPLPLPIPVPAPPPPPPPQPNPTPQGYAKVKGGLLRRRRPPAPVGVPA